MAILDLGCLRGNSHFISDRHDFLNRPPEKQKVALTTNGERNFFKIQLEDNHRRPNLDVGEDGRNLGRWGVHTTVRPVLDVPSATILWLP